MTRKDTLIAFLASLDRANQLMIMMAEHEPTGVDDDDDLTLWHWGAPAHPMFDEPVEWTAAAVLDAAEELVPASVGDIKDGAAAYEAAMAQRELFVAKSWVSGAENDAAFNALFKSANRLSGLVGELG